MIIKEIITRTINTETGEATETSNFQDGKLYGLFSVVSNKSVRQKEKFHRAWYNRKKEVPSTKMEHTNRGWFIDGYHVDERSVSRWFQLTDNDRTATFKPKKRWNSKKNLKKSR